jgi:hypothetical protein
MFRFVLFLGFLVGIGYVLTEPPQTKIALSANEIPVHNDKPLLTSWGPTLGSLRDGIRVPPQAAATTMLASNETSEAYGNQSSTQDPNATAATAATAASVQANNPAADREPVTTVANAQEPVRPVAAKPVDRVAAALPPQRRGLFSRALAPQAAHEPRVTRGAQAAPRNGGLFKRLLGRGKQPARAWALGPAR